MLATMVRDLRNDPRSSREAAVAGLRAREDRQELAAAAAVFDEFPFAPDDMIRVRLVAYLRTLGRHAEGRAAFEALRASLAPRWLGSPPIARLSDELEQHGRYLELLR